MQPTLAHAAPGQLQAMPIRVLKYLILNILDISVYDVNTATNGTLAQASHENTSAVTTILHGVLT